MLTFDSKLLVDVMAEMMEMAAFIFISPSESPPPWTSSLVKAQVTFQGPSQGLLSMVASEQFSSELACNIVGTDCTDLENSDLGKNAMGEMLNIYAGALMERLFGNQVICHLGIPEVVRLDAEDYERQSFPDSIRLFMITDEMQRIDILLTQSDTL